MGLADDFPGKLVERQISVAGTEPDKHKAQDSDCKKEHITCAKNIVNLLVKIGMGKKSCKRIVSVAPGMYINGIIIVHRIDTVLLQHVGSQLRQHFREDTVAFEGNGINNGHGIHAIDDIVVQYIVQFHIVKNIEELILAVAVVRNIDKVIGGCSVYNI